MKGCDGYSPFGNSLKIGVSPPIKDELASPDPVVFLSPRIHLFDHGAPIVNPSALLCNLIGLDLLLREVGNIDIEKRVLG